MLKAEVNAVIEPLIKRGIFATEEDAIRELLRDYMVRQIAALQREMGRFERKYGMPFERYGEYLHERSVLLPSGRDGVPMEGDKLSAEQRQVLGRAIMKEEDDWLDWKVTKEMLEGWLGLRHEVAA